MGLAMDLDDIKFCQAYFKTENRCPTITEIKMIDTYWSDHCRHTTFLTTIDSVKFEDKLLEDAYNEYVATREFLGRTKPINLMDIATITVKYLRKNGKLEKLELLAVELGFGKGRAQGGLPMPAKDSSILERYAEMSKPFGVKMEINGNVATVIL